ncbi:ribonuclease J [Candidatus Wolfebacteria bacterium]|nr:ribonuclease J [Candidatus Wolfebacteria bacterium]
MNPSARANPRPAADLERGRERRSIPKTPSQEDAVRFVALGGLEEVGRNMMFFEYKNEIVIIDIGLQFPEEDTPGIDFIIPNTTYLESKKENIKAVIITHGHYDHIGAVPYLMARLGNPTIYTTALTKEMLVKRQEEFTNAPRLDIQVVKNRDKIRLSENFEADFFSVTHTIPDTTGVILKTPAGNLVHFAEMKFDYDKEGKPQGLEEFEKIGKLGIHALFIDSTNAEVPGFSVSERVVEKNLEDIVKKAQGRVIIGIFSSLLTRIAEVLKIAEKYDRRVAVSGLSMKTNIQIAQNLGYIKTKKGAIITLEEIHKYKDEKLLILSTGAQGEPNASLMRIASGEHRQIEIKPGDTVVFSSSVIPGNERSIQGLKDNLTRQGAKVYTSKLVDIHSTGHAPQEELKVIMKLIKPRFVIPIHGYYFMRAANAELAHEVKIPKQNVFLIDNGQVIHIAKEGISILEETVPAFYVMVDGLGVGDVGEVVMRDRRVLAQEGMVVVIATLDRRTGRFLKNPDIISRGFIYLRENKDLVEDVRKRIRGIIGRIPRYQELEPDYIKTLIRDQIGQFLYNKTRRRPMILPVVIEV